jgi:hypothetical protein
MKRILYNIFFFGLLLSAAGCTVDPEDEPLDEYTEDYVFDPNDPNGTLAIQFLNNVYTHLPTGFNRVGGDMLDAATDDAIPSRDNTAIEILRKGRLSSVVGNPDGAWDHNYAGIRKANIFLNNIDVVPAPEATSNYWKADARFLRAMFYFELLKRYGGVPLVGDTVYHATDVVMPARNTFAECVDFIVSECDAIKDIARPDPVSANDFGRISKAIVLTLKAKVLNYAASPLYNGGNIALGDGDPANDALQGYLSYDASRWEKAAQAAKDVINLNVYTLAPYTGSTNAVFYIRRNTEVILSFMRANATDVPLLNGPIGYLSPNRGEGRTSPTQDLVDAFPANTGRPVAAGTYPTTTRDPRLVRAILYNGTPWLRRTVQTYEGGLDKPNNPQQFPVQTKTSYYSRKFSNHFTAHDNYTPTAMNFHIFRYADVLLMYVEAVNEFNGGPTAEVYTYLQAIRQRAGIAAGTVAAGLYGITPNMNQVQMRDFIRNERRIELCFEEQRYWDVRRWKIAEQVLNKGLRGMRVTTPPLTYTPVVVDEIVFDAPRMYMYPIPNSEMLRNRNLVQNMGW